MRAGVLALLVGLSVAGVAHAKDPSPENVKGLYLTTDFPAIQIRAGEDTTLPITIYNFSVFF